ncbi:hypothetical protein GCM10029964_111190 [Kibdelosporangium lantanae]
MRQPAEMVDVAVRDEHGGDLARVQPLPPQGDQAGGPAVQQDRGAPVAWMWTHAWNLPPLPNASPDPANTTRTAGGS